MHIPQLRNKDQLKALEYWQIIRGSKVSDSEDRNGNSLYLCVLGGFVCGQQKENKYFH